MLLYAIIVCVAVAILLKYGFKTQSISAKHRRVVIVYYIYFSIAMIFVFGNSALITCLFLSVLITSIHAAVRKTSLKSKLVRFADVYNDFGPISTLADWIHDEKEKLNHLDDTDEHDVEAPLIESKPKPTKERTERNQVHDRNTAPNGPLQSVGNQTSMEPHDGGGLFETSKLVSIALHDQNAETKTMFAVVLLQFVRSKPVPSFSTNASSESLGIYHGDPTSWQWWPFMASLRHSVDKQHCCGASIVSLNPPRLLTSAGCVDTSAADPCTKEVIVGCDSGNCLGPNAVSYEIEEIVPHPDYSTDPSPINDLAIITLKVDEINEPENVTAIDMQQGVPCCELDHPLFVLGYGREAVLNAGDRLLQAQEEYLTNDLCNNMTQTSYYDDESVLCFMDVYNERITVCQGDRGGPIILSGFGQELLVGVISWYWTQFVPIDCLAGAPQAAANVGYLYEWIESNLMALESTTCCISQAEDNQTDKDEQRKPVLRRRHANKPVGRVACRNPIRANKDIVRQYNGLVYLDVANIVAMAYIDSMQQRLMVRLPADIRNLCVSYAFVYEDGLFQLVHYVFSALQKWSRKKSSSSVSKKMLCTLIASFFRSHSRSIMGQNHINDTNDVHQYYAEMMQSDYVVRTQVKKKVLCVAVLLDCVPMFYRVIENSM